MINRDSITKVLFVINMILLTIVLVYLPEILRKIML